MDLFRAVNCHNEGERYSKWKESGTDLSYRF